MKAWPQQALLLRSRSEWRGSDLKHSTPCDEGQGVLAMPGMSYEHALPEGSCALVARVHSCAHLLPHSTTYFPWEEVSSAGLAWQVLQRTTCDRGISLTFLHFSS